MRKQWKKGLTLMLTVAICFTAAFGSAVGASAQEVSEAAPGLALYVAPDGDDSAGDGTSERPFLTLERARDHIRDTKQLSGLPAGGITVYLREGEYPILDDSFLLEEQDSGTAEAPIVYRSYPGEQARLFGGKRLDAGAFSSAVDPEVVGRLPAGAAAHVIVADLPAIGIPSEDYGGIVHQGQGWPLVPSMMELFVDGEEMTLGRYPNADWLRIDSIVDAGTPGNSGTLDDGPTFVYNDASDRALAWTEADDIWMFGYFFYDWAEENMKVEALDAASRTVAGLQSAWWGINPNLEHRRFYFYNLLEEVDAPGEWYLDRADGKLYLYPPAGFDGDSAVELSFNAKPIVKTVDASYVQFRDLTIGVTRSTGIKTQGGAGIVIANNEISNTGLYGIEVGGGSHHTITGNHVFQTGAGGIIASGGHRPTLTPSGHAVTNNHIHAYSRIKKTYAPGIRIDGVGTRVAYNSIHDSAHYAINFSGNDHVIEYNEIFDVLQDSNDSGAIYTATDYSYWGNVIRYNYFHDIIGREGHNVRGVAVYLDDNVSGTEVYGNVMENVGIPFYTHGGRNNKVYENVIINPLYYYVRGIKYGGQAPETPGYNQRSLDNLLQMPYQGELWRTRYPELAVLTNELPVLDPKYNEFTRNLIVNQHGVGAQLHTQVTTYGNFDGNVFVDDPEAVFMNWQQGDYRLRPDSSVYAQIGFADAPLDRAGLLPGYAFADDANALARASVAADQPLLNTSRIHLAVGESASLTVTARSVFGEAIPEADLTVAFESSDAAVATVDGDGAVSAVAEGSAVVTAAASKNGTTRSVAVEVVVGSESPALDRVELTTTRGAWEIGMEAPTRIRWFNQFGQELDLSASPTVYASSAPDVVSVDTAGRIRALAPGAATVTATTSYDGIEKTSGGIAIDIVATVLTDLEATLSASVLEPGQSASLNVLAVLSNNAKVAPEADELEVTAERPDVVSVGDDGTIKALREGGSFIEIAVTIGGATKTKKLHVAVFENASNDVPAPWAVKTFGSNGRTGFARFDDGTFRVVSNGDSMGPSNDSFTFVHRDMPNSADKFAITATILGVEETHPNAAAGLHIRGSINEDKSKGVTLQATADGRLELVTRSTFQGAAFTKAGGAIEFPAQIKLTKEGTTFIGYVRTGDGWTEVARSQNTFNATNNLTSGLSLVSFTHQNEAIQTTEAIVSGVYVELAGTDKTALADAVSSGKALHDAAIEGAGEGQYPAGAKASLLAAIGAARAVIDAPAAAQPAVDDARQSLLAAIETFASSANGAPAAGPSWPEGAAVAATSVGADEATLVWTPAQAASGIARYRIDWAEGSAFVPGDATTYTVTELTYGTDYTFRVFAEADGVWTTSGPETSIRTSDALQVAAKLGGPSEAAPGDTVTIDYRLQHLSASVLEAVYAQDITFVYDADRLTFVDATGFRTGLQAIERDDDEPGTLRIVAISEGAEHAVVEDGLQFQLVFEVKPVDAAAAADVSIVRAELAGGDGTVVPAVGSTHRIDLPAVDRTALLDTIATAIALHDEAVEGRFRTQYAPGVKAALLSAVQAAQATAQDGAATQSEVNAAKAMLDEALADFAAARNDFAEGDIDGNGAVNVGDLGILAAAYGASAGDSDWTAKQFADLNGDGAVDVFDLSVAARKMFD
ncbi:hypothetical protein FE782_00160 [Paenibacillus antri]|uniref:Probable pectate lyase C n=1 Tax=Paenibacillus antri TaxID=2582848 RepID=A0A5R9GBG8_9BACL|nr:right-handed parallel beta-helix repeat-containing protein [Paenibacillus antri]TLS53812.1 hypothetical protein FE782_00160 [Paenibacillus antri]